MNKINWDKNFALEQAAGDATLLQELLEIFKGSYGSDLGLIKEGIDKGDARQIYTAAHSIKGAAASLGIDGIREIASQMETDSREGSLKTAMARVQDLEEMFLELKEL